MIARLGIVCTAAFALVLAGCSWRVETPPPVWPSPDAVTVMRDAAALREQAVIDASSPPAGSASAATPLADLESADAPTRLEALGGVYVAYPSASPSPAADGAGAGLADAVTAAREGHLADALVATDADLAALLGSAGLAHALSEWFASWVEDRSGAAALPVVAERTLDSPAIGQPGLLPEGGTGVDAAALGQLALAHDEARYAYEVMAARAAEDERDRWLARRDLQDARGQALAALPGVEDLREAVYVVEPADVSAAPARLTLAVEIESGLGETYAAQAASASATDKPWLLSAAFDAYAQASAFGEPSPSTWPVPALPGIEPEPGA